MGEISVKTGNNARNGGKNSLNRLIRCVCGKKIGPDPRNFNQRVSLGRNDLLIRTFLNTARSGLINEKEMIDALRSGQIMGAALDTFDDEPLPDDSAFYTLNNVTITPHIAGSTIDAFSNSPKRFAEILLKKLS
ncbi:hypothetical protein FP382_24485 [Klebsiella quasipneumoniae]|nr:hypothetical protein [Klebsiella quasipneumoniae]